MKVTTVVPLKGVSYQVHGEVEESGPFDIRIQRVIQLGLGDGVEYPQAWVGTLNVDARSTLQSALLAEYCRSHAVDHAEHLTRGE